MLSAVCAASQLDRWPGRWVRDRRCDQAAGTGCVLARVVVDPPQFAVAGRHAYTQGRSPRAPDMSRDVVRHRASTGGPRATADMCTGCSSILQQLSAARAAESPLKASSRCRMFGCLARPAVLALLLPVVRPPGTSRDGITGITSVSASRASRAELAVRPPSKIPQGFRHRPRINAGRREIVER
jgi:hypothetical protein